MQIDKAEKKGNNYRLPIFP